MRAKNRTTKPQARAERREESGKNFFKRRIWKSTKKKKKKQIVVACLVTEKMARKSGFKAKFFFSKSLD